MLPCQYSLKQYQYQRDGQQREQRCEYFHTLIDSYELSFVRADRHPVVVILVAHSRRISVFQMTTCVSSLWLFWRQERIVRIACCHYSVARAIRNLAWRAMTYPLPNLAVGVSIASCQTVKITNSHDQLRLTRSPDGVLSQRAGKCHSGFFMSAY